MFIFHFFSITFKLFYDMFKAYTRFIYFCDKLRIFCDNYLVLSKLRYDFVTLWPWPLTIWPNTTCWTMTRDALSLWQVWQLSFEPFWFYPADRQTDRQNHKHTDADERLTPPATTVDGSNKQNNMTTMINVSQRKDMRHWSITRCMMECLITPKCPMYFFYQNTELKSTRYQLHIFVLLNDGFDASM